MEKWIFSRSSWIFVDYMSGLVHHADYRRSGLVFRFLLSKATQSCKVSSLKVSYFYNCVLCKLNKRSWPCF